MDRKLVTMCMTHFKSLTLANLAAALYSVRQQDLSQVESLVVVNNDTSDTAAAIHGVFDELKFSVPILLDCIQHGDPRKTHAWSTNRAFQLTTTPWVFFTRADYLLDFSMLKKCLDVVVTHPHDWNGFVTAHGQHLGNVVEDCEKTNWRQVGPGIFGGATFDYTKVDSGVYLLRRSSFDLVGGMDERLFAWGHSQTEFQHRLYRSGVEFVRIPEVLFHHPWHGGPRDIARAHEQLGEVGGDLKEMWKRYEGASPY